MNLVSLNFKNNQIIDKKYTCYGKGVSPQLSWSGEPIGTKSFVLILDDPDAVGGFVWDHWVIYNIPNSVHEIDENGAIIGAKLGKSTNRKRKYIAPCPPKNSGLHHYRFTIYAIDKERLSLMDDTKRAVLNAIKNHTLAKAELIGLYERKNRFFLF